MKNESNYGLAGLTMIIIILLLLLLWVASIIEQNKANSYCESRGFDDGYKEGIQIVCINQEFNSVEGYHSVKTYFKSEVVD